MEKKKPPLVAILGQTASGKTRISAHVADRIGGEILSADSRQVYKNMNIGTGKDYDQYLVNGQKIPYHLIDLVDPGIEYNLYRYMTDFLQSFKSIIKREKVPVICGGSGLYLHAILKGYDLAEVPVNRNCLIYM